MALVTCPTCGTPAADTLEAGCSTCQCIGLDGSGTVNATTLHVLSGTALAPRPELPESGQTIKQPEAYTATRSTSEETWTDPAAHAAANRPPARPEDSSAGRPETSEPAPAPPAGALHRVPFRWHIARLSAAISAAIAAIALTILMILPGEPTNGLGAAHPRATATRVPPTSTPVAPTPTAQPGFAPYADTSANFRIEYPASWKISPQNPGIEFDDNDQSPNYVVQVLLPDASAMASQTDDTTAAASWVDFALTNLQQRWGSENFQRLAGPTPSATIGGQTWRTGVALIGVQQSRIRVQVFATVRAGKPYIINVLAVDTAFKTGQVTYFQPMLSTFEFLPSPAS